MRGPTIAALRQTPLMPQLGQFLADMLVALDITDDDFPDIIPDDLDYDDPAVLAQHFPKVLDKLGEVA